MHPTPPSRCYQFIPIHVAASAAGSIPIAAWFTLLRTQIDDRGTRIIAGIGAAVVVVAVAVDVVVVAVTVVTVVAATAATVAIAVTVTVTVIVLAMAVLQNVTGTSGTKNLASN